MATLAIGVATAFTTSACGGGEKDTAVPQRSAAEFAASGLDTLPIAPESKRVDLKAAPFSEPTKVTNALFPISDLHSAVLNGHVDGKEFHTETTLLPQTRIIEWAPGQEVETVISQYAAFLDGRVEEVALDYYAQADDGSVWYFGEDVFNYNEDGVISDTDGTWLAGKEGPAAMIMPGNPKVGDVHRPENIPGVVFEEVAIKTTDETLNGPTGPVEGSLVSRELHDDGTFSDKQFAPGYGEFFSAHEGDLEAMAVAAPTDALDEPVPADLETLSNGADQLFEAGSPKGPAPAGLINQMTAAWQALQQSGDVPPRLVEPMDRALAALGKASEGGDPAATRQAAVDVAQAGLDLELRYRPAAEIDRDRFELWTRQILLDAGAGDVAGVTGDLATMEWVRDRFAHTLEGAEATAIDAQLETMRDNVVDEDLAGAAETAAALREKLAALRAG